MTTAMRFITVVIAALGMMGFSTGSAAADAPNGGMVPLTSIFRACDQSKIQYVPPAGNGNSQAVIGTGGTGTVTADVRLAVGTPNTPYNVRLIQVPRPASQPCNAGDPGVAAAVLVTDGVGTGAVTVQDSVRSGATGAWVFIEGPPDPGEIRGEYYTSDLITSLN
jgi:hypothetical protein